MAYVYFEKLVLQGKLTKQNRKLCAGACVLLAAKISSDLRRSEVKQLIDVSARCAWHGALDGDTDGTNH